MKKENTNTISAVFRIITWIFGIVFFTIGVLNLFLVHAVPGIFYFLLSFMYFPLVDKLLEKRFNFSIPIVLKLIFAFIILWGTLAVGDLAEILGL